MRSRLEADLHDRRRMDAEEQRRKVVPKSISRSHPHYRLQLPVYVGLHPVADDVTRPTVEDRFRRRLRLRQLETVALPQFVEIRTGVCRNVTSSPGGRASLGVRLCYDVTFVLLSSLSSKSSVCLD